MGTLPEADGSSEPGKWTLQNHKGSLGTLIVTVTEMEEPFLSLLSIEMGREEALGWEGVFPRGVSPK